MCNVTIVTISATVLKTSSRVAKLHNSQEHWETPSTRDTRPTATRNSPIIAALVQHILNLILIIPTLGHIERHFSYYAWEVGIAKILLR